MWSIHWFMVVIWTFGLSTLICYERCVSTVGDSQSFRIKARTLCWLFTPPHSPHLSTSQPNGILVNMFNLQNEHFAGNSFCCVEWLESQWPGLRPRVVELKRFAVSLEDHGILLTMCFLFLLSSFNVPGSLNYPLKRGIKECKSTSRISWKYFPYNDGIVWAVNIKPLFNVIQFYTPVDLESGTSQAKEIVFPKIFFGENQ